MSSRFRIEPLRNHERSAFSCGEPALDNYFRRQIGQDVRRRAANAFVAVDVETEQIAGFFTLSAAGVNRGDLPERAAAKAPPYKQAPAVLLGRMAVAQAFQGVGLGAALLANALTRAATSELGVFAMIVQPKNERARAFYLHYGFDAVEADPSVLFLLLTSEAAR